MQNSDKSQLFSLLRKKHSYFIYENFTLERDSHCIKLRYFFNLSDEYFFEPTYQIPVSEISQQNINDAELQNLAFHIGMIELISYWKVACPPKLIIKPAALSTTQVDFWKNLWFKGLGEFFYTNSITTTVDDFVEVVCEGERPFRKFNFETNEKVLVPVGGGKDSVVTLELLKRGGFDLCPFILNPRQASIESAKAAGFKSDEIFDIQRTIDPTLIQLNKQGFLNGHTPFSAMLGFVTLLAARLIGARHIALSNESSANEVTIPGTDVNHQYSKSFDFESNFRAYVSEFISEDFNYFSFLRPLNELQIAKLFSGFPHHLQSFRSCNVGSKKDQWCGKCPKCLFTWIILEPFLGRQKLSSVFGTNMLEDPELKQTLDELSGVAAEKPFECVGTVDEVNAALVLIKGRMESENMPVLLQHFIGSENDHEPDFNDFLVQFNSQHFLSFGFEQILKRALL